MEKYHVKSNKLWQCITYEIAVLYLLKIVFNCCSICHSNLFSDCNSIQLENGNTAIRTSAQNIEKVHRFSNIRHISTANIVHELQVQSSRLQLLIFHVKC